MHLKYPKAAAYITITILNTILAFRHLSMGPSVALCY